MNRSLVPFALQAGLAAAAPCMAGGAIYAGTDTYVQAVGGPGGTAFQSRCDRGQLMVGLALRGGAELDAVAAICATAINATEVDRRSQATLPQTFGGYGGTEMTLICPSARPIVKSLYVEAVRKVTQPDRIRVDCTQAKADRSRSGMPGPAYSGLRPGEEPLVRSGGTGLIDGILQDYSACPPGQVGVGIHGASGNRVDRIGLICAAPVSRYPGARTQLTSAEPTRRPVRPQSP